MLPRNATKLHGIEFLQQRLGYGHSEVIFAGDSGNDLPVLVSPIPSVLVANASAELKQQELQLLGFCSGDLRQDATQLLRQTGLEQVMLTRGAQGALVCTASGECHSAAPQPPAQFVDTVGAGDAFTAVYLHGLLAGWPIPRMLALGQRFAGRVIGLRGATTTELDFYREFIDG